jgi:hypothetical protein
MSLQRREATMKFLVGLVIGAIIAAAIGAGAIAIAFGELDDIEIKDRDRGADVTRTLDFKDFDKIEVAGVYELNVTVGPNFAITLAGSEEELDRVKASLEDGALVLDQSKRQKHGLRRHGVTATISMPALSALDISGVVDGDIEGVAGGDFAIDLSGVGDVELSGECDALTARVSGVGDLNAEELKCKTAKINVSGVGDAAVYASEAVEASISGMGEIDVYGSPASVEKNGGMFSHIEVH